MTRPGRPLTDAPAEPTVTRGVRLPESMATAVDLVRGPESFSGWVRGAIEAKLRADPRAARARSEPAHSTRTRREED